MLVRVAFENGSTLTIDASLVDLYFPMTARIKSMNVIEDTKITKETRLENNSFSSLVGAIDAIHGHTYEDPDVYDHMTDDLEAYFDELLNKEGDHYYP
jgi:hypothetical protein